MDLDQKTLALLPGPSRKKFERLLAERDAAHAAFRAASDREQAARQEAALREAQMRDRLSMPGGVAIDQHPASAVVAQRGGRAERERTEAEARLMEPVEAARRRHQAALDARERAAERQDSFAYLDACIEWLKRADAFGGVKLHHLASKPPRVKDPVADINRLRSELAELDDAWAKAEAAPAPASELKERFEAELDALAQRGKPTVYPTSRAGSPVDLAAILRIGTTTVSGPDGPRTNIVGNAGATFWLWLLRDQVRERIFTLIDEAVPAKGALTHDEREAEFARINAERLKLERAEEALICALEVEGRIVERRRDADPRAVLEVREV